MSEETKDTLKNILKKESSYLNSCPFCGAAAEYISDKSGHLMIVHRPNAGICCPTRMEQVCDTFEIGRKFWNNRYQFDEADHKNPETEDKVICPNCKKYILTTIDCIPDKSVPLIKAQHLTEGYDPKLIKD